MPKTARTENLRIDRSLDTTFYEKDKWGRPGEFVMRKFRDADHLIHDLIDLSQYTDVLIGVYAGRTMSPRFREKIMRIPCKRPASRRLLGTGRQADSVLDSGICGVAH